MWFRISWFAILIAVSGLSAYFSKRYNQNHTFGNFSLVLTGTVLCGILWSVISRYSKNLVIDSSSYDIVMFLSWVGFLSLLGCGQGFTVMNWIGLIICCIGFTMMAL